MDYKTLLHDFNQEKKALIDFINLRNKRNVERAEEMVEDYIVQMATGDYSIKSYKAKIIHNELDCNHAMRDVEPVREKTSKRIEELIDAYFEEYLDNRSDDSFAKQKTKDMRDYLSESKRKMHEVQLKKNNIDKDFKEKGKDLDNEKKEKLNSYNEKINSLKMRLVNDLKKLNEKTIKDYSEYEIALLDNDDKVEIKNLKEKIKEIRRVSIDEEYKIKMDTYDEILNEELTFTKSYQEFIYELEKYRLEMQIKLAELERDNDILTVESDYKDKYYDINYDKRANNRYGKEIKALEELINKHNELTKVDYSEHEYTVSDKMFLYDLALLEAYELQVKIHNESRNDQLGSFLTSLINLIEKDKETYVSIFEGMKPLRDGEVEELSKSLEGFVPNPKKKQTKEELVSNVVESLDRYFDNYLKEIDYYNILNGDLFLMIVRMIWDRFIKVMNKESDPMILRDVCNYSYTDLEKYGYKLVEDDNSEVVIPEGEEAPLSKDEIIEKNISELLGKYNGSYDVENERVTGLIDDLNKDKEEKVNNLNKICEERIEKYNNEYKETIEKNKKELLEKEKEVVKSTSKSKEKAKKLLIESKKAL